MAARAPAGLRPRPASPAPPPQAAPAPPGPGLELQLEAAATERAAAERRVQLLALKTQAAELQLEQCRLQEELIRDKLLAVRDRAHRSCGCRCGLLWQAGGDAAKQAPDRSELRLAAARSRLHDLQVAVEDAAVSLQEAQTNLRTKRCELDSWTAANEQCVSATMVSQPDTVLLEVFRYLPRAQLVGTARQVCRRWRALAECRSLWTGTQSDAAEYQFSSKRFFRSWRQRAAPFGAVPPAEARVFRELRAAPRVDRLRLELHAGLLDVYRQQLIDVEWRKDVAELSLEVSGLCAGHPFLLDLLHALRDGLKSIHFYIKEDCEYGHDEEVFTDFQIRELFLWMSTAPKLTSLKIDAGWMFTQHFRETPIAVGPLRLETLYLKDSLGDLERAIIQASKASLRKVHMSGYHNLEVFSDLGECPLLEHVAIWAGQGLEALSACARLHSVILLYVNSNRKKNQPIVRFLRSQADGSLRRLAVYYFFPSMTKLTQLQSLAISGESGTSAAFLLQSLPNLEELYLRGFPKSAADLTAITAELAPKLRVLYVRKEYNEGSNDEALDQLCAQRPDLRIQRVWPDGMECSTYVGSE